MITHKKYGQLLYNAVLETLETMAFAEVVLCSCQVGNEEFSGLDALEFGQDDDDEDNPKTVFQPPVQTDFSAADQSDTWAAPSINAVAAGSDDAWGSTPAAPSPNSGSDPWGISEGSGSGGFQTATNEINFNSLVEAQEDWVWSCMRVNSPDVHSVWFIVSKSLAMQLAQNMYAGEGLQLDSPVIRDLVAELTNVLGGRLMLLLEKMGGQFTLAVPDIGTGLPTMPDPATMETVLCKVLVDGEYPVMSSICFNRLVG